MNEGDILICIRADLQQHDPRPFPAEAILENYQNDKQEGGPNGNYRRGDEKAVTAAGLREDEEIHRANEDAESD